MKAILAAALTIPTAVLGDGYSGHKAVVQYREKPCTVIVAAIDADASLETIATQGMLWGFLLGFDAANGGLQGSEETTLVRLRKACAADPDKSALSILEGFK